MSPIPNKPFFPSQFSLVTREGELIVDGCRDSTILRGFSIHSLLPRLLPLLDGTATVDKLCGALQDISRHDLIQVLGLLTERGLIQELDWELRTPLTRDAIGHLRRLIWAGSDCNSTIAADEAIARDGIWLLCDERGYTLTGQLRDLLLRCGEELVEIHSPEDLDHLSSRLSSQDHFQVIAVEIGEAAWLSTVDAWCRLHACEWLRIALREEREGAELGPLFGPDLACYRCFAANVAQGVPERKPTPTADVCAHLVWAGIAATTVIYQRASAECTFLTYGMRRYNIGRWNSTDLVAPSISTCPHCDGSQTVSPARADTSNLSDLAREPYGYETYVGARALLPAFSIATPDDGHQASLVRRPGRLAPWDLDATPPEAHGYWKIALREILQMTVGVRGQSGPGGRPKRWCAAAGNLGSPELYTLVQEGPSAGAYYYHPLDNALCRLRGVDSSIPVRRMIEEAQLGRFMDPSEVVVAIVAGYDRLKPKYGCFGYRLSILDVGVALSQMSMLAAQHGLYLSAVTLFDEAVFHEAFCLNPTLNPVVTVAILSATPHPKQVQPHRARHPAPSNIVVPKKQTQRSWWEMNVEELTDSLLVGRSELSLASNLAYATEPARQVRRQDIATGILLPPSAPFDMTIFRRVIASRTSVRSFANLPITVSQIGSIVAAANLATPFPIRLADRAVGPLRLLVYVNNADGLPNGFYHYCAENHSLMRHDTVRDESIHGVYLQAELGSAPLHLFIGSFPQDAASYSDPGLYRARSLYAATAAHRASIAAVSVGLNGTLVAGIRPRSLGYLFGSSPLASCVIAFVAGIAHDQDIKFAVE